MDGYNRLAICQKHGLPFRVIKLEFESEGELLAWIEDNARARRNQTRTERNYYLGCRYLREKGKRGAPEGNSNAGKTKGKSVPLCKTAALIASQEGCSDRHVKNWLDGEFGWHYLNWLDGQSRDKAAAVVGIGSKAIDKAAKVVEHRPDLAEKVTGFDRSGRPLERRFHVNICQQPHPHRPSRNYLPTK